MLSVDITATTATITLYKRPHIITQVAALYSCSQFGLNRCCFALDHTADNRVLYFGNRCLYAFFFLLKRFIFPGHWRTYWVGHAHYLFSYGVCFFFLRIIGTAYC